MFDGVVLIAKEKLIIFYSIRDFFREDETAFFGEGLLLNSNMCTYKLFLTIIEL